MQSEVSHDRHPSAQLHLDDLGEVQSESVQASCHTNGNEAFQQDASKEAYDPTIYQSMIGRLVFPMTTNLPGITFTIRVLIRYNPDPSNEHMAALNR
jgi:hypothetical protein